MLKESELAEIEALCAGKPYTIAIHDFTGSEEDRSALENLRRIQAIVDCVPGLMAHIRQQAQELEGEKRASKIYREEAEGLRLENEKLKAAIRRMEPAINHVLKTPMSKTSNFHKLFIHTNDIQLLRDFKENLVGEVRPIFQEGDVEVLQLFLDYIKNFDINGHLRDVEGITTKQGVECLERLIKVAKGGGE